MYNSPSVMGIIDWVIMFIVNFLLAHRDHFYCHNPASNLSNSLYVCMFIYIFSSYIG